MPEEVTYSDDPGARGRYGPTQWALEPQIDIKIWSVSWHNISRLDFDILVMSNCKYQRDINTWGQKICQECVWKMITGKKKKLLKKSLVEKNVVEVTLRHQVDVNS